MPNPFNINRKITMSKSAIYFIAGSVPTKSEAAEIEKLGMSRIRNASLVSGASSIERCDTVAGAVPTKYKNLKGVKVVTGKQSKEPKAGKDDNSLS
jgi:hypothetical protein